MQLDRSPQKAQEAIVAAQRLAENLPAPILDAEHLLAALSSPTTACPPRRSAAWARTWRVPGRASRRRCPAARRIQGGSLSLGPRASMSSSVPRRRPSGSRTSTSRPSTCCSALAESAATGQAHPEQRGRRPRQRCCTRSQQVRGGQRVTSAEPRGHLPGAREVRPRPDRSWRAQGKLDPVIGRDEEIRRVDPGAVAPDQEQPGPDRRARRRQDRDRRGPGPAHRPRRRARGAEGQAHRRARPGRADRRRQVPRRVRGAAQGGPQGGHGRRGRRSSCSSTSCTPSSAPARPKARWTPRTCSSRCWRAASCTASARPRSTSTASTSRRTPRSSAASSRSSSTSRRSRTRSRSCAACASATRCTTASASRTRRWSPRPSLSQPLHHRPLPARQGDRPGRRGGGQAAHGDRLACRPSSTRSSGACMQLEIEREALRKEKDDGLEGAARGARAGAGRPEGASATRCERSGRREKDSDRRRSASSRSRSTQTAGRDRAGRARRRLRARGRAPVRQAAGAASSS